MNAYVTFKDINNEYSWSEYGKFKAIVMNKNGYINMTKLCALYNKDFYHWMETKKNQKLIQKINETMTINGDKCCASILKIDNDGSKIGNLISGTYVHELLVSNIASWSSYELSLEIAEFMPKFNKSKRVLNMNDDNEDEPFVESAPIIYDENNDTPSDKKIRKSASYIYLIQDGKDMDTDVYKIGKTTQENGDTRTIDRFDAYSENTIIYRLLEVDTEHVDDIERKVINIFRDTFTLVQGREWFKGDIKLMKTMITDIVDNYVHQPDANNIEPE